jgi:hypothetical protein
MELRKDFKVNIFLWFALFCFFSLVIFLLQNFLTYSDFLEGLFIPDVINMSNTFDNLKSTQESLISSGLFGVYAIYYLAWITHPALSIIINLIFIYFSIKLIYEIFVKNNFTIQLVCLGLFVNPYVFLAVTGPNKEIPLIWASLYVVRNLILKPKRWFVKAIILSCFVFLIRDGYGVILFLATIIFSSKISVKLMWKIALGLAFLASILTDVLISNLSVIERNFVIAKSINGEANSSAFIGDFLTNNTSPFFSIIKESLRMLYNWITLAIFPLFYTDTGSIYTLGFGYWIFGVFIFMCILASLYLLVTNKAQTLIDKNQLKIVGFIVFAWSTISISLFIQPRYLMPILPLAFGILYSLSKKTRIICIFIALFFSFSTILIYNFSGNPPAKYSINDSVYGSVRSKPSFLIFNSKD